MTPVEINDLKDALIKAESSEDYQSQYVILKAKVMELTKLTQSEINNEILKRELIARK